MNEGIQMKVKACLDKESNRMIKQKLQSYNLGKEFNYAVAVLKLIVTNNGNQCKLDSLKINLTLKVQYITPFVTKDLAKSYCEELASLNMIMMLLPVKDGKVDIKEIGEDTFGTYDAGSCSTKLSENNLDDIARNVINKIEDKLKQRYNTSEKYR